MSSFSSNSNHDTDYNISPSKKRKLDIDNMRWKNVTEQQMYTTKLVEALNNIPRTNSSTKSTLGRVVRETADRVLAVTAKGKSRWSRAILTSRLSSRLCQINRVHKRAKARKSKCQTTTRHSKLMKSTEEADLKKKVKLLGSLIPGCRNVSFPSLLEESSDYIAALEMQVLAMSVLTELLGGGATSLFPSQQAEQS